MLRTESTNYTKNRLTYVLTVVLIHDKTMMHIQYCNCYNGKIKTRTSFTKTMVHSKTHDGIMIPRKRCDMDKRWTDCRGMTELQNGVKLNRQADKGHTCLTFCARHSCSSVTSEGSLLFLKSSRSFMLACSWAWQRMGRNNEIRWIYNQCIKVYWDDNKLELCWYLQNTCVL